MSDHIAKWKARCIIDDRGCWLWQGFKHANGYPGGHYGGKSCRIHRKIYELAKGPIPAGHDVCHACDVRHCINPDHLWTGTRKENMQDCSKKGRADRQWMTSCEAGHPYTEEKVRYTKEGWRQCNACQRIRQRMRAGWTREQAESIPSQRPGKRPVAAKWQRACSGLGE